MDADRIGRTLTRIAHEILERNRGVAELGLVGIRTRGVPIARRLARAIAEINKHEVPTGAEPEGVFISEDGKILYVTSEVGDLVHMVDAEDGHVIQDVVVATRPRRFAATPDKKELWVTAELSGEVYIIDREKFEVTGKIDFLPPGMRKTDVTPVGLTMTKDGKTAYVTLGHAAHVAVVDVATRKVETYILVGKRSWGITLSKDESKLYVANGFGDDITIIDVKSRKATISIPVGRIPWGVVIDE